MLQILCKNTPVSLCQPAEYIYYSMQQNVNFFFLIAQDIYYHLPKSTTKNLKYALLMNNKL